MAVKKYSWVGHWNLKPISSFRELETLTCSTFAVSDLPLLSETCFHIDFHGGSTADSTIPCFGSTTAAAIGKQGRHERLGNGFGSSITPLFTCQRTSSHRSFFSSFSSNPRGLVINTVPVPEMDLQNVDVERHTGDFMEAAKKLQLYFIGLQHDERTPKNEKLRKEIAMMEEELKTKSDLIKKHESFIQVWRKELKDQLDKHVTELERV